MRIIAGTARGRSLAAPRGMDTRPTLDRVRESLFSILQPYLPQAHVLDLFAGSGALGLEALSRGADLAVFVDYARTAQEAIRHNIRILGAQAQARLLPCDYRSALRMLTGERAAFDLIFLDPPYQMAQTADIMHVLREAACLAPEGLAVFEHATSSPPDAADWSLQDRRRYGDTSISFYTLL